MKLSKQDLKNYVIVTFDWDEIEKTAPTYGGVYIMIDEDEEVVYINKTENFKDQLIDHWEMRMWEEIFDVYCIKAKNKEQLYEKLVAKYQPRYNDELDK